MDGVDPQLVEVVRDGTYVVDARAVAEAIVGRRERRLEAARLAAMLESGQLDGLARDVPDDDAGARADVA